MADPFVGYGTLEGLEHLGRHIVDPDGQPSGSPANFEYMRGTTHPDGRLAQAAAADRETIAAIAAEYADVGTHAATAVDEFSEPETPGDVPVRTRTRARRDEGDGKATPKSRSARAADAAEKASDE